MPDYPSGIGVFNPPAATSLTSLRKIEDGIPSGIPAPLPIPLRYRTVNRQNCAKAVQTGRVHMGQAVPNRPLAGR